MEAIKELLIENILVCHFGSYDLSFTWALEACAAVHTSEDAQQLAPPVEVYLYIYFMPNQSFTEPHKTLHWFLALSLKSSIWGSADA